MMGPKSAMGLILNLRNGKQFGFLMGSAHQSFCFAKLMGLAEAGLINAKKQLPQQIRAYFPAALSAR